VTTARLQAETGIEPLARHLIDGCALGSPQHRVTSSHTATADDRSFLNRDLLKSANSMAGTLLMFCGGLIMTGTLALLPTMLQNLMNYPALTTGLVTMPRGIGGWRRCSSSLR
jgi:DHA2 family multidrug resistance protein